MVKNLPANAGNVRDVVGSIPESGRSPGKGMAAHSSILAWRIPWTGAWWATIHGAAESDMTERNNMLVVIYMKIYQKDKVEG